MIAILLTSLPRQTFVHMSFQDQFVYKPPLGPLSIVYEDDDLIIIDKPAGLLSVMGRLPEHQDSAYLRVLDLHPQAKVTHRLDMATSGILMFAKHRQAEVAISKMFQARSVEKEYIALVQGQILAQGEVKVPLITDWENRPKQIVHFELGKAAQTLFHLLDYDASLDRSRVKLTPITGRSHQLRVHMQYIGHPIVGDRFYHPQPLQGGLGRMALHAHYMSFQHPLQGEILELNVPASF